MGSLREKLAAKPVRQHSTEKGSSGLELERAIDTFDPYSRLPTERAASSKRDLHKLSEWIKMMKALEQRKKSGEEPADS